MSAQESELSFPRVGEESRAMSLRVAEILSRLDQHVPEAVCLTETHARLLSQHGHTICSQPDYGYTAKEGRRKVMLWSREPWDQVDDVEIDSMPPGRFVSGVTQTSVGEIAVIGICIPWFGARTEASRQVEHKMQWEDHEWYLAGLTEVLGRADAKRLIVMGDFNQIIGKGSRARPELQVALLEAFPPSMRIATSDLAFQGHKSIDHVALSADWTVGSVGVISNIHEGRKLSDHFGVAAACYFDPDSGAHPPGGSEALGLRESAAARKPNLNLETRLGYRHLGLFPPAHEGVLLGAVGAHTRVVERDLSLSVLAQALEQPDRG